MHIYGKSNRSTLFGSKWHGTCIPRSIMLIAEVKYHQRRLPVTEGKEQRSWLWVGGGEDGRKSYSRSCRDASTRKAYTALANDLRFLAVHKHL